MAKSEQNAPAAAEPPVAAASPAVVAPSFTMPSPAQVAAARVARKESRSTAEYPVGTVLGMAPGWVAAKLDPTLDEGRKAILRAKWSAKGWIKMDGLHQVVGYPLPIELWVKPIADFNEARAERDAKLQELARSGQMILGHA